MICEVCDAPILAGEDFDNCAGHTVHYRCLPVFTMRPPLFVIYPPTDGLEAAGRG